MQENGKFNLLIEELFSLVPDKYYTTEIFQKDCYNSPFGNYWNLFYLIQDHNVSLLEYKSKIDKAHGAIILLCQKTYEGGINGFYELLLMIIRSYCNNKNTKLDLSRLKRHLFSLGIRDCSDLDIFSISTVDAFDFENGRLNTSRMSELQGKVINAVNKGDYTGCNTVCYTLLEGVFKEYCKFYNVNYNQNENIVHLAGIVKADIRERFPNATFVDYSIGDFVKIVGKIAESVKDVRDNSSDSHYSKESDKVTSIFLKDMVFSLCNFMSNIIEMGERLDS